MKKLISTLLAIMVVICSLSVANVAFAASKNVKTVATSTKVWSEINRESSDCTFQYKFAKNKKVTVVITVNDRVTKKTVKYTVSKNVIKFSYKFNSLTHKCSITTINNSNLLKIVDTTKYGKYVTLIAKGNLTYGENTAIVSRLDNTYWSSPSLRKANPTFQCLVVHEFSDGAADCYIAVNHGGLDGWCLARTKDTAVFTYENSNDLYIIEKTSNPNKMNAFLFKNNGNKFTLEKWTRAE